MASPLNPTCFQKISVVASQGFHHNQQSQKHNLEDMAAEKIMVVDLDACTTHKQVTEADNKPNTKGAGNSNYEKALAQRALFGSHNHRVKARKFTKNGARLSPSRLSKVSLAEE